MNFVIFISAFIPKLLQLILVEALLMQKFMTIVIAFMSHHSSSLLIALFSADEGMFVTLFFKGLGNLGE